MRFIVIRNEESISDVANKAYKGLSASARKKAEKALLRANPELRSFRTVGNGFIVRVPDVEGADATERRTLVDPIGDVSRDLSDGLGKLEETLAAKFAAADARGVLIAERIKSAGKAIKNQPGGDELAKALKKHLSDSKTVNDKKRKLSIKALTRLRDTLASGR